MDGVSTRAVGVATMEELAHVLRDEGKRLDWAEVERLVDVLDGARRVLVFGAGRSGSVALAFAQRLTHVGVAAAVVGEAGNARCTEQDVVVVVSGSGATPSAVAIAQQSRAARCGHLCLLTKSPSSPIRSSADIVVTLHGRSKGEGGVATLAPYTAQFDLGVLAVSEVVARMLMDRRGMNDMDIERWRPNVE